MKQASLTILFLSLLFVSCDSSEKEPLVETLFEKISSSQSGIDFTNDLIEDEDFNIIEYLYFYNGAGVAIGDINNDGLSDVYLVSNQHPNQLYLNKGDFRFEDISAKAGVEGKGNWKTGVSMADVNGDGWLDIMVCGVGRYKKFDGFNQLFINNHDLTFTERSAEYGLNFQGFSTQTAFFDYDRDGDLDMYLLNHSVHTQRSYGKVELRNGTDSLSGDRLYKNLLVESGQTKFEDVTQAAGIFSSHIGYGLGLGVSDLNNDGFPDIYVSNDFTENDYLYINNRDGTFSQTAENSFGHTSRFSMGNDIADINNDGKPDIITLDMLPKDEQVLKTSAGEDSYEVYAYKLKQGFHRQVSRNVLQLNQGISDSGNVVFSDIAPAAGVEATDWSWGALLADFDGDGWKDLFITNGILRRPNDLDYINFISDDSIQNELNKGGALDVRNKMPSGIVSNVAYKNNGHLAFTDQTKAWGLEATGVSNGAAFGDLDNDGDPDLVVNQLNGDVLIYRNHADPKNFVKVSLATENSNPNRFGVGSKIVLSQQGVEQVQELYPVRGWCSSSDYALMFGLVDPKEKFTVQVTWPDGVVETLQTNERKIIFRHDQAKVKVDKVESKSVTLVEPVKTIAFEHHENEFNAFNRESLIPHMLSTEGPPMATGDVDGDGSEDVYVGGGKDQAGVLFIRKDGVFIKKENFAFTKDRAAEDTDAAFFDADGDHDLDLIVVSGGQEEMNATNAIEPRLYLNDGHGNFKRSADAFVKIFLQASCVKPADYDNDGDIDLFIGASVIPMLYGMSPTSYLLNNNGRGKFTNNQIWLGNSTFDNPTRVRPGMIQDATWADINNDGLLDMIVVGEWMPITVLIQQPNHQFSNQTTVMQLTKTRGWWNSIHAADMDNDGDIDFVVGNLGLNSRLRATADKPLYLYVGDFDSNGGSDHILVYYNGDKLYPFVSKDQLIKQLPALKKKFLHYYDYRDAKLEDIITPQQKGNSVKMQVDRFSSVYLENRDGKLIVHDLPVEAQEFPVYTIAHDDVNHDGFPDLLLAGNMTATQPELGPYDAGFGLVLLGNGKGDFKALPADQSGFWVPGEARDIEVIRDPSTNRVIYLVSRNNKSVISFSNKNVIATPQQPK